MTYKSIVATQRGGPEVLQVVENELRPPRVREARIKVLAAGIGRTDITYRYGASPLAPDWMDRLMDWKRTWTKNRG